MIGLLSARRRRYLPSDFEPLFYNFPYSRRYGQGSYGRSIPSPSFHCAALSQCVSLKSPIEPRDKTESHPHAGFTAFSNVSLDQERFFMCTILVVEDDF